MIKTILSWFLPKPKPSKPKYRLVPTKREGKYDLEKLVPCGFEMIYVLAASDVTPEGADEAIKNLERTTLYYRDEP